MKKILVIEVFIQDDKGMHVEILKDFKMTADAMQLAYKAARKILDETEHMNKATISN